MGRLWRLGCRNTVVVIRAGIRMVIAESSLAMVVGLEMMQKNSVDDSAKNLGFELVTFVGNGSVKGGNSSTEFIAIGAAIFARLLVLGLLFCLPDS